MLLLLVHYGCRKQSPRGFSCHHWTEHGTGCWEFHTRISFPLQFLIISYSSPFKKVFKKEKPWTKKGDYIAPVFCQDVLRILPFLLQPKPPRCFAHVEATLWETALLLFLWSRSEEFHVATLWQPHAMIAMWAWGRKASTAAKQWACIQMLHEAANAVPLLYTLGSVEYFHVVLWVQFPTEYPPFVATWNHHAEKINAGFTLR